MSCKKNFVVFFMACFLVAAITFTCVDIGGKYEIAYANGEDVAIEYSPQEVINNIETELNEKGSSIIETLKVQKQSYIDELENCLTENKDVLLMIIDSIDEAIEDFENNNILNNSCDTFIFSPNSNSVLSLNSDDSTFARDLFVKMACNAIAAGFYARGWILAADLLWFNLSNKTMDIDYFPSLGYRVANAPQIRDELAYNNDIANGFNQSSPGRLNGVFASTIEGDAYNALGKFYFTKKYAGNGNVNIQIIDRYDWEFMDKIGLGEGLNNTLYLAQLIGIATPFYTRINITIPGSVPFEWEYNDVGITITRAIAGVERIIYPTRIYDLREKPVSGIEQPNLQITKIAYGAFSYNTEMSEFTVPASVEDIGNSAFSNMPNLESVYFDNPATLINIGDNAFYGCEKLARFNAGVDGNFVLPPNLSNIGKYAFYGCKGITDINLHNKIESIGEYAFSQCTALKTIFYDTPVTRVVNSVFSGSGTSDLKITISENVTHVPDYMFKDLAGCSVLFVPVSVESIGSYAFSGVYVGKMFYGGGLDEYYNLRKASPNNGTLFQFYNYTYSADKPYSGKFYWKYNEAGEIEIWQSKRIQTITANGKSRTATTTEIKIVFDSDVGNEIDLDSIIVSGANKVSISGTGKERILTVSDLRIIDSEKMSIKFIAPEEYYFVNPEVTVTVYAQVYQIAYFDVDGETLSGTHESDYPKEYMYGQRTYLDEPIKLGYIFAGWFFDIDGSGDPITYISSSQTGNIRLYAKWEPFGFDTSEFDSDSVNILYYTPEATIKTPDLLFATTDKYDEFSYYLREALFPAFSQLNVSGYGYQFNYDIVKTFQPSDDAMSATIVIRQNLQDGDGNTIFIDNFKLYYDFVVDTYEVLPSPWKYISSVSVYNEYTMGITLNKRCDFAYVLHEFRALPYDINGECTSFAEANLYAYNGDISSYGKYVVSETNSPRYIQFVTNPYYVKNSDSDSFFVNVCIDNDMSRCIMGYQSGAYDVVYNLDIDYNDIDYFGDEAYVYDTGNRIYLGIGKNSALIENYGEDGALRILYALGYLIDYDYIDLIVCSADKENNDWFPDDYPGFNGANQTPKYNLAVQNAIDILESMGIDPNDLELSLVIKDNEKLNTIAFIIQQNFAEIGVTLSIQRVSDITADNNCDLTFSVFDFTGAMITDEDLLKNGMFTFIFSPFDYEVAEELNDLFEMLNEDDDNNSEILRRIQDIISAHVIKLCQINRYYLAKAEYVELTNGRMRNLIY